MRAKPFAAAVLATSLAAHRSHSRMSSIMKFTCLLAFASLALCSSATAQFGNNLCSSAYSLADGAVIGIATSTSGSGISSIHYASGINPGCGGTIDPIDDWYSWSPDADGIWNFSTCNMANYDTRLALYSSCAAGAPLACNDDGVNCLSFSSYMPVPGLLDANTYFIQVGGFNAAAGQATLDITTPLGGDGCSTAITVTAGPQTLMTDTTMATASGVIPSCGGGNPPKDRWYSWNPNADGDWLFSTCNQASYDTRLALFSACNGAELGCNDDSAGCLATSNLFVNNLVAPQASPARRSIRALLLTRELSCPAAAE